MQNNDAEQIEIMREELKSMSIIKKAPLLLTYVVEKSIEKLTPNVIKKNSSRIGNFLLTGSSYFFTIIFPALYIYKRDQNNDDEETDLIVK